MNCGLVSLLKGPTARCGYWELKLVPFVANTDAACVNLSHAVGPTQTRLKVRVSNTQPCRRFLFANNVGTSRSSVQIRLR